MSDKSAKNSYCRPALGLPQKLAKYDPELPVAHAEGHPDIVEFLWFAFVFTIFTTISGLV